MATSSGAGALSLADGRAQRQLPLEIMGCDAADAKRARRYLELADLSGFERKFPWQLSGGMQQRASIARALSFDPARCWMDEPFGALDEIVADHLTEQLLRLWTIPENCAVRHPFDPEAVFRSTRIVVMSPRPGRIIDVIACDSPRDRTWIPRNSGVPENRAARVCAGLRSRHSYDE
jgi:NitT/TauT family transport system ATP-binding protein